MLHPHPGCSRTESRSLIVHRALLQRANSLDLLVKRPLQEFHFTNKTFGLVVANARVWTETFSFLDHLLYGTCKIFYPILLFRLSLFFQGRYRTHWLYIMWHFQRTENEWNWSRWRKKEIGKRGRNYLNISSRSQFKLEIYRQVCLRQDDPDIVGR